LQEIAGPHVLCVIALERRPGLSSRSRDAAVHNLLTNAIKYSPRADTVMVRLLRDAGPEQAIVSVQDCGIGIDQVHHEKIFERFYQVTDPEERTFPGLGIGLYISSEIVKYLKSQEETKRFLLTSMSYSRKSGNTCKCFRKDG
jgi:sensor histidine kinase regulating citrate/malate metabolism